MQRMRPGLRAQRKNQKGNQRGFSLLEILIAFGIIGTIVAIVVANVTSGSESAKKKETSLKVNNIQAAFIRYQQDMGKLPETSEGLGVLITNPGSAKWGGPYLGGGESDLKDGWGNNLEYEKGPTGPKITSQGGSDGIAMVFVNGRIVDNPGASAAQSGGAEAGAAPATP